MDLRRLLGRLFRFIRRDRSFIPLTFSLGDRRPFGPRAPEENLDGERLTGEIEADLAHLRAIFVAPTNVDLVVREFTLTGGKRAFLAYLDGMVDRITINYSILQPLMLFAREEGNGDKKAADVKEVVERFLPGHQLKKVGTFGEASQAIVAGNTVVFVDGDRTAVVVETKGWEHRTIGLPQTEQVVRGPQEGFVETLRANTAAIRRILRSPSLVTEIFTVGARSRTDVAVMYLYDVANKKLVAEVKRRVRFIGEKIDFLGDSGMLEQLIEDHPHAILPQVIATERPDRCAAFLSEGHVVI
ncbi:MAG: spore germination protein, partial [Firmicutes bacterium]|nr:spore germination protein [Bacillota bacterium]